MQCIYLENLREIGMFSLEKRVVQEKVMASDNSSSPYGKEITGEQNQDQHVLLRR